MNRPLDEDERRLWAFVAGDPHLRRLPGRLPPEFRFKPRPGGPYGPDNTPAAPTPPALIDLHGLNADQAYTVLELFLRAAVPVHAAVTVIVGRGAVLRHQVPRWLRHGALREGVRDIREAPAHAGGSGAFVLRLRPPSARRI